MVFLVVILLGSTSFILGRYLLGKWLNHLSIYSIIWSGLIILYEIKLLPYVDIIPLTWLYILLTFISFLTGVLTITTARNIFSNKPIFSSQYNIELKIFKDNGRVLRFAIIFFSLISVFAAVQNWMILLNIYGNIPNIIINSNEIYLKSMHNEIKGITPYISYSGYIALFFVGIYSSYKGKISILTFLPFIGIILKELAVVGRVGMLFGLFEFLITFILFRNLLNDDKLKRFGFSYKNGVIASIFLIAIFITATSFVRISRGTTEDYAKTSSSLRQWKGNILITPTIYLYLSSDLGVLNKYLESGGVFNSEENQTQFGVNTFLSVYNLLSKFHYIERPENLQRGYYIPMWSNTGTFIRELHADFGVLGIIVVPYILGLILTWLWLEFYYKHNLILFTILVYLELIVVFSFLVMITRLLYWGVTLLLIIFLIPILERLAVLRGNRNN